MDSPKADSEPALDRRDGSTIRPLLGLWAIIDPNGNIVHTMIGLTAQHVIELWMTEEQTLIPFFRGTPAPSWELYEAEGYRTARVDLIPSNGKGDL